jgi:L-ascorbate metabolism protein UlaG (beta-lactamase superfamily)
MHNQLVRALFAVYSRSPFTTPSGAVPMAAVDLAVLQTPPVTGLRVTWFGHSTLLVEIEGKRVLVDPVWSERIGSMTFAGPKRWYGPLILIGELPAIDAVAISHDRYDHLDYPTIVAKKDWNTSTC